MSRTFSLQDPGEGIHEAEVAEVLVAEGDSVEEDDSVMVVTTDKADSELPSPFAGTVETVHVSVGDIVEVGDPLVTFDGDEDGDEPAERAEEDEGEEDEGDEDEGGDREGEARERRREDEADRHSTRGEPSAAPVPASPSTRRLARELEVDITDVEGSGPGGRVLADDVREAAEGGRPDAEGAETKDEKPTKKKEKRAKEAVEPEEEPQEQPAEPRRREEPGGAQPLRGWRRATARRVAESWRTIPHVTHMDRADITDLETFRAERAPDLTMTAFVVKAAVGALSEHPRFNATFRDDELEVRSDCHVGVAVDTERGLVVPVLTDADRRSLREIGEELEQLGERARSGSLERDDVSGGTFTVTNVGPLGGTAFTPIIVPPQVAILGLARAARTPVVTDDDEIAIRTMLPICLAFDHRINDGADAARFVSTIVALLEDPDELLMRS